MSDRLAALLEKIGESEAVAASGNLDDLKAATFKAFDGPDGLVQSLKAVYDSAESDQVRSKIASDLFGLVVQSEKQAASRGPADMSDEELAAVLREMVPTFVAEMAQERFGDAFATRTIGEFLSPAAA